ncbi:long-chain fatty acid--CoA ligase [Bordetella pseudohinzii]|uniref:Long-chain fatty acid--CoA ligase n=1 Tax=Bordetella pseudohinzii TaxID=1331258 RepID=A0A0M7FBF1_9BORD|nr:AMP-binding protein [Bordetella pseudohinzii]ANY17896.1 long-chain fatty acid--CoA ligase [Bordetella pseudohinzii]KXA79014.1 long-chain fatty acid--CoA ligase [Bordetella pseudohinzii]KXA80120.1 long-chain fatty acid--CoA ligase [Bordetella pseudohinzii]CUI78795.1 Long-chain-fatty-acid--CoA ligase FadD15 [Bordetella pseudohinzii]
MAHSQPPARPAAAQTFPALLLEHASVRPSRPAIREKDLGIWQTLSWADVAEHVRLLAHGLAALGIGPGKHIAVIGENRPRLYIAMMAAQALGAIPVPLYQDAVAQEMVYVLQDAEISVAIVEDQEQVDKMLEVRAQCPALKAVVYDDPRGMRHYHDALLQSYEALEETGRQHAQAHPDFYLQAARAVRPDDTAAMFYTSGTTGKPKGVVLTHHALIDRARAVAEMEKLSDQEDVLAYLPPAWIGQNMFSYTQLLVSGFTVNHPESPDTVPIDMRDIGPTYYFAPPRVLEGLLTHVMIRMEDAGLLKRKLFHACMNLARRVGARILDGEPVSAWDALRYKLGDLMIYGPLRNALGMSRVRVAYTAGEAIGPDLFVFYRSIGINLKQLYGSTETSVFVCVQPDGQVRDDTVGPPVDGVQIRVADSGEILVKSPGLFKEYYRNPAATAEARDAEGWFHTGDAGYLDSDGQLKIIDRAKDVGKLADGSLFAPKYIENKLKFFPHIKEAVAFGADRDQACAFINIDLEAVGNWAERRGLPYAGYTDLAAKDEVYALIRDCVEKVNADLANDPRLAASQIHRFLILHKELDPDDDELTRTRKVRRAFIAQKYGVLIDALYSGKDSQFIETEVKFEDGRSGKISADLRICPAKTYPAITAKAA